MREQGQETFSLSLSIDDKVFFQHQRLKRLIASALKRYEQLISEKVVLNTLRDTFFVV